MCFFLVLLQMFKYSLMQEKEHVKFISAQQAKSVHLYKNTKEKLLKNIAAIWFNKMCRLNHFTPKCNTSIITLSGST
jgi:hypothetical protein